MASWFFICESRKAEGTKYKEKKKVYVKRELRRRDLKSRGRCVF